MALASRLDAASSRLASSLRLWNGFQPARRSGPTPVPELDLYEYEASPYCRRVRETLCVLGLRHRVFPCPRETLRREGAYSSRAQHKPRISELGGRLLFPFLHDRSADMMLNESRHIVEHLWLHYGQNVDRPVVDRILNGGQTLPRLLEFGLLAAPSGLRPWPSAGLMAASASRPADGALVLHACEHDVDSRAVRELLCELQLPYVCVPTSTSSPIPHLEDPSTDFKCFGARAALSYLEDRYRLGTTLPWDAPTPEPNLGDKDRTSWLTRALDALPTSWHKSGTK